MRNIYTTTLRLNLSDPEDHRAWEHLRNLDKKHYRSYSKAIVTAVNDYFDRQERLEADPYLETREKEDAFLEKVLTTIREGLQASPTAMAAGLVQLLQSAQPISDEPREPDNDSLDVALDFADSF